MYKQQLLEIIFKEVTGKLPLCERSRSKWNYPVCWTTKEGKPREILCTTSCWVFPSIHPEAFGIVAAEPMASGLAISSCVGGAGELVQNERTGLAFEAGNNERVG